MNALILAVINLVIGVVLQVAATLWQQARETPAQQQNQSTGMRGTAVSGGKVPKYFLVGTVGEAGKFEYGNEWGEVDGAPNANAVDVISFGDLPISAMTGLYVNGVLEPVSTSGHVAQGFPTTGDKAGKLWIEFYDGTQTTASSYLTSKFGSDPDRPWGADRIGRGIPYITATTLLDDGVWTRPYQDFVGVFQGIPLYDPRKDSTAGGSGNQRWGDPSTWTSQDNNIVITYNIQRGIYYDGEHVWGGTATEAQLPYGPWAAAMDACDELVNLNGGGTEKRYRAGRKISFNERPADVVKEFLVGCNGRICHASDGTIYPLVGVPQTADGAFSDADVLATNPVGSIPHPNLDDVINGATAVFRAPQQAWEDKETAPYYRADLVAKDDGREQVTGLNLNTTFSGTQAQRVLKAAVEESRRFRRHVVALPPEFAIYRPLQVLAWTGDTFDYSGKLFLIIARTVTPWGPVVLGLQEIDPIDQGWDPATDETDLNYAPAVTNRPAPQEVSGVSVAPAIAQDANGTNRRGGYDVFWPTAPVAVDIEFVRISHRLQGETDVIWTGLVAKPDIFSGRRRVTEGVIGGEVYEVQVSYIALSGREIIASDWMVVQVPNVGLNETDFSEEINLVRNQAMARINDFEEYLRDLGTTVAGLDAFQQQNLVAKLGDIAAAVRIEAKARADETGSLASAITAVVAQYNDVSGGGLFSMVAEAAPAGYSVKLTLAARTVVGGAQKLAAISVLIDDDGDDFIIPDASKTLITGQLVLGNNVTTLDADTGDIVSTGNISISGNFSFGSSS